MKVIGLAGCEKVLLEMTYDELNALTGNRYATYGNYSSVGYEYNLRQMCIKTQAIHSAPDKIKSSANALRSIADLMETVAESVIPVVNPAPPKEVGNS